MNSVDFVSWLDDKTLPDKWLKGYRKDSGDVTLVDTNGQVKIRVRNVGSAVIGIPEKMGQWRIVKTGEWDKQCDYIMFGDHPKHGRYVFLIEFKETPTERWGTIDRDDDGGRMKLRWNINIFHYLLSLFNVDTHGKIENRHFTIRRFLIGKNYSQSLESGFRKGRLKGNVFDHEEYQGVWINFLATSGSVFPVNVRDMICKSK